MLRLIDDSFWNWRVVCDNVAHLKNVPVIHDVCGGSNGCSCVDTRIA